MTQQKIALVYFRGMESGAPYAIVMPVSKIGEFQESCSRSGEAVEFVGMIEH